MPTKTCPNCESWLLLVNGQWMHQHTTSAYACFEKQAVEAGTPYVEPVDEQNETMKFLLEVLT